MTTTATPTPKTTHSRALPPGPRGHFILGMLPELQRDLLGLYGDTARQYGDVVTIPFLGVKTIAVSHPDHFKHILQDYNKNYHRNAFFNTILHVIIGDNLFTTDGDDWLSRRRLMQPAFHRQRIASFSTLMTECVQAMLERWDSAGGQRLPIDQEMMALTLRVAGKAFFSVDLSGEANAIGEAFTHTSEYVNYRFGNPYAPPLFIPTRQNRTLRKALRTLDDTIYGLIRARRETPTSPPSGNYADGGGDRGGGGDLLGMLMEARDADTGEGMSDKTLRNEVATMMFAGHETTAAALTWTFYLLSQHPEAERKLHAELSEVLAGRAPTMEDLPRLKYTRMVIDETMRLYPPAWGITRQSVNEDEIGGCRIPANSSITLALINAHYDPRWWENPERFDPERFTPERSAERPAFAYAPFGGGPRLCIGNQFALTEATLALALIAQRYQLRLVPNHPVKPHPIFVLRTSHGLPMTVQKR